MLYCKDDLGHRPNRKEHSCLDNKVGFEETQGAICKPPVTHNRGKLTKKEKKKKFKISWNFSCVEIRNKCLGVKVLGEDSRDTNGCKASERGCAQ